MTGFDIFDRYDAVMSLLVGGLMVGALALGAPLWAVGGDHVRRLRRDIHPSLRRDHGAVEAETT